MKTLTCYRAVFNVGTVDVWSSEMYLDKDAIFDEMEEAKDEIADAITGESFEYSDEKPATYEMLARVFHTLRNDNHYRDKENRLDFFILEQTVWKNREEYIASANVEQY